MCGRFAELLSVQEIKTLYYATPVGDWGFAGNVNVAPTEQVPVIIEKNGERELHPARFGIPMTASGKHFSLLNIRSETAGNREDIKIRRCVIPVSGFYEWEVINVAMPDATTRGTKEKQPHYFSARDGHLSLAGVWKRSESGLGFSILTTQANELVAPIHKRMPVILGHNAVGEWLAGDSAPPVLMELMQPFNAGLMQAWKVSKAVNSPKYKEAACINSL